MISQDLSDLERGSPTRAISYPGTNTSAWRNPKNWVVVAPAVANVARCRKSGQATKQHRLAVKMKRHCIESRSEPLARGSFVTPTEVLQRWGLWGYGGAKKSRHKSACWFANISLFAYVCILSCHADRKWHVQCCSQGYSWLKRHPPRAPCEETPIYMWPSLLLVHRDIFKSRSTQEY